MRRFLTPIVSGLLLAALVTLCATAALAGSPWWDDRLDGTPVPGYDGMVVYTWEVLQAPISLPPVDHLVLIGWVQADPSAFTFTDYYGNSYSGTYHAGTGCYLSSDVPGQVVQAMCYDGSTGFFVLYGTLVWDGSQGVITGPWEFRMDGSAYSGPLFRPMGKHVR